MKKGSTHTPESIEKFRAQKLGVPMSEATKKKIGDALRGKPKSPEHIRAAAEARKGIGGYKLSEETRARMSTAKKRMGVRPPVWESTRPSLWKENINKYNQIHATVRARFGSEGPCEHCGICRESKAMHWANISGSYLLDRSDWQRLCAKCHKKEDIKHLKFTSYVGS